MISLQQKLQATYRTLGIQAMAHAGQREVIDAQIEREIMVRLVRRTLEDWGEKDITSRGKSGQQPLRFWPDYSWTRALKKEKSSEDVFCNTLNRLFWGDVALLS